MERPGNKSSIVSLTRSRRRLPPNGFTFSAEAFLGTSTRVEERAPQAELLNFDREISIQRNLRIDPCQVAEPLRLGSFCFLSGRGSRARLDLDENGETSPPWTRSECDLFPNSLNELVDPMRGNLRELSTVRYSRRIVFLPVVWDSARLADLRFATWTSRILHRSRSSLRYVGASLSLPRRH